MSGEGDELSFQIDGDASFPTRVITLNRVAGGQVRVREWTSEHWQEPRESQRDPADVLREVEAAHAMRRRVSADLRTLREWLGG